MTLHKKIILQLAFHANKRKYSHAFGKLCHVRMFLNTLIASNLFRMVLDRMDVASVERITQVNKLYAFTYARILGPYIDKRRSKSYRTVKNFWRLFGRFRTTSKLSKLFVVQGKMTDALRQAIEAGATKQTLEDLYLPYKPKRRTKSTV